jgi:hypothetical protein
VLIGKVKQPPWVPGTSENQTRKPARNDASGFAGFPLRTERSDRQVPRNYRDQYPSLISATY